MIYSGCIFWIHQWNSCIRKYIDCLVHDRGLPKVKYVAEIAPVCLRAAVVSWINILYMSYEQRANFPFQYWFVKTLNVASLVDSATRASDENACAWWRHQMETFSALLAICVGNSPVPGEFPTQRPVARSFDVFFHMRLNKRFSKQSWGWWFETLLHPLWRHCNDARLHPKDYADGSHFVVFCWG